jgi:flagellar protein FliS
MIARGAEAYRQTEARSRSPLELVVMLYDGALRFLGEAHDAAARQDARTRALKLSRVLAIVGELQSTLNVEKGGDVAVELDRLYTYIRGRILDVTMKNDLTGIDETQKLLTALRESWSKIAAGEGTGMR